MAVKPTKKRNRRLLFYYFHCFDNDIWKVCIFNDVDFTAEIG